MYELFVEFCAAKGVRISHGKKRQKSRRIKFNLYFAICPARHLVNLSNLITK